MLARSVDFLATTDVDAWESSLEPKRVDDDLAAWTLFESVKMSWV
jgi:hypothetical protein